MLVADKAVVAEWTQRIRAEYQEMPGLSLTKAQMRRLWLLDCRLCDAVVDGLVASGFLECRPGYTYARRSSRA
jgi:hypothetical protein